MKCNPGPNCANKHSWLCDPAFVEGKKKVKPEEKNLTLKIDVLSSISSFKDANFGLSPRPLVECFFNKIKNFCDFFFWYFFKVLLCLFL